MSEEKLLQPTGSNPSVPTDEEIIQDINTYAEKLVQLSLEWKKRKTKEIVDNFVKNITGFK